MILASLAIAVAEQEPPAEESAEVLSAEAAPLQTAPGASSEGPGSAGLQAFIDPATGELIEAPSAAQRQQLQLSPELQNALSVSSEGLQEEALPGGGIKVDLQGRFQSAVFATVGPDGTVTLSHGQVPPSGEDEAKGVEETSGGGQ